MYVQGQNPNRAENKGSQPPSVVQLISRRQCDRTIKKMNMSSINNLSIMSKQEGNAHASAMPKEINDLTTLIEVLEDELAEENGVGSTPLSKKDRVEKALQNYTGSMTELGRYALFDKHKNYTRNLIATDHETYTLMLLCWNKGKFSPIHDHPCDGCWVKVIAGAVQEVRYQESNGKMEETENNVADSGVMYMHDSMGYHKVGNPSDTVDAITLHLYCPPFQKCRMWLDETNAGKVSEGVACLYSEYGEKIDYSRN